MSLSLENRHLYGAGAAACAVCCAAPVLAVLGIAGAAATLATLVFAGIVFALVVAAGAAVTYGTRRRRLRQRTCQSAAPGPVDLPLTPTGVRPAYGPDSPEVEVEVEARGS